MSASLWFLLVGMLFVFMALAGSVLRRLPLTTTMIYLGAGVALGPLGLGIARLDPQEHSAILERVAELAVIVSLFTAGLKLRAPLSDPLWRGPIELALVSMGVTVGLIAVAGVLGLGLPIGAAILLGAILAPTDPVLASDVQVEHPRDRDRLRFTLTGEAGLNDGTAFPFMMLGLGLIGLHDLGDRGLRWLGVDVVWAVLGGLAIGGLLGTAVGRLVLYLRQGHKEAVGLDDFLALGLIAVSYGAALLAETYGFLSVFSAGLALRRIETRSRGEDSPDDVKVSVAGGESEELATHPEKAPAYMAAAVLGFNEQLERIAEVGVVILLGVMISTVRLPSEALWFVPLLLLVIRPLATLPVMAGSGKPLLERGLTAWFGIRGLGSIYYLMHAIEQGVPAPLGARLTAITLTVVAVSIVVHGISVTPLMNLYRRRSGDG